MKDMLKELYTYAKEDPKEFILGFITVSTLFGFFYVLMWFGAIIEGRV